MNYFLAWFSAQMIRLIGSTLRVKLEDGAHIAHQPDRAPAIIAFWHNRMALMTYFYEHYSADRTALTFISRSRDGQFITDVAARFGIKAIRGSSSRHGTSAMLTAIRAAGDRKVDLCITPDGPRGPKYQIQPGLIRLAQLTQRPIVTVTYRLPWKYELKSWDRFHVPLPFSTCHLVIGGPIFIPEEASERELAALTEQVTRCLGGD